ncbi:MAG: aminopeptidase N, partial [Gammaproteobacteria bacterium]|nr:aminopeptidase N [Gammaproteobacteria bacterium]
MTDMRGQMTEPKLTRLAEFQPYPFKVSQVELTFELDPLSTRVTQVSQFQRCGSEAAALVLNGLDLALESIAIDGMPLDETRYQRADETLTIPDVPDAFTLVVITRISPAANTALEGLYVSNGMFCTQCEAEGFRRMTYYPDRPDVLAKFRTRMIAPASYPTLLSNGNLISETTHEKGVRDVVWEDPFPKPCYLFALVAGDLACASDTFVTCSGRSVGLRIYVEEKDLGRVDYAMASLKRAMRWDEEVYGREYDLDLFMIVAVSHFNMGAMENKGLNIFNTSCVLASPDSATDQAFQRIEAIVAHEYFHNWSGNRVTCRDWFQLSLKEGFTVFRDSEFSADLNSRAVKRIQDVSYLRTAQFNEDGGPTAHPVQPDSYLEISNFYTLTIYEKGAEVVRMLATLLGPTVFRQGTDLYFDRHDGSAATIEDFAAAMAEVSGRDLSQFMQWYRVAGTPQLSVTTTLDGETLEVTLRQAPPAIHTGDLPPFLMPVRMAVIDASSGKELVPETVVELSTQEQTLKFPGLSGRPVLSVLRGLSAPVKLEVQRSIDDRIALARHDQDGVSQWDAMQSLWMDTLVDLVSHGASDLLDPVTALVGGLLTDSKALADPARLAELLALPADTVLWDRMRPADPQAIVSARKQLRTHLARTLVDAWSRVYSAMRVEGPYRPVAEDIGKRSLGFIALGMMARQGQCDGVLTELFSKAENLTERFAAYRIARADASPEVGAQLSEQFLAAAETDEVLDLWLSTEAVNESTATLARVQE